MQTLLQDLRYALRQLRRSPGFALTAILTLALGIGATTAIFTLVYQVLLRSIPVSHPEQLYKIGAENECCVDGGLQTDKHWRMFSYDLYRYLRDQTPATNGVIAVQAGKTPLSVHRAGDDGSTQALNIRYVSGNYFPVLGIAPYQGRMLTPEDDLEGATPAAVISYAIWQTRFAADPHLVGSTLIMTGVPVTVVGISNPHFLGERNEEDLPGIWVPIAQEPVLNPSRALRRYPDQHWLDVLVRIQKPADVNRVQLAIQGELHQWIMAHLEAFPRATPAELEGQTTELTSASSGINNLRDDYAPGLKLLLLVSGFVLLIACANVANLMIVRGMARRQELALRSALGALRARLIRQMLVEAILLAFFGGVAALVIAYGATHAILALAISDQSSPLSASPSLPVLGFAFALSLVTGILFGIAPAWIGSNSNPAEALRGANRSTRDASATPQKVLVVLQAALSLAMLCTAGLLITSLRQLEHQNFHFGTEGRLVLFTDLQSAGYKPEQLAPLYQQFENTFGHAAGIASFTYANYSPMANNSYGSDISIAGIPPDANSHDDASFSLIGPHYFETVGSRILLGRAINEQDTSSSNHVAVVNSAFVKRYLGHLQPIGAHFGKSASQSSEYEIVGVAEDTKYNNANLPTPPMFFAPLSQTTVYTREKDITEEQFNHYVNNLVFHYRGDEKTAAAVIREGLKSIDPNIPIFKLQTYDDQLSSNFTQEQLVVRLTTIFGVLALVLASIGLYGVTAYAVARRTSEIGIRMALGASRLSVLKMILRSAMTQALLGLCIGIPLTLFAGRLVQSTLYQTSSFQPLVLLSVSCILLTASIAAALIPASRAASLDPMLALRME